MYRRRILTVPPSTVSNAARRRGLEWDYSEDLGSGGAGSRGQAAASLSTLEKMAIGSYSEFLEREEPEGRGEGREARGGASLLPQAGQEEMVEGRMSKFADSLMKQRELQVRWILLETLPILIRPMRPL